MPYSSSSSSSVTLVSKCTICPTQKSSVPHNTLKLSVSDLPMLACHYIQKGVLLHYPPFQFDQLISMLKDSLAAALFHFPALAGRFATTPDSHVHVLCNDAGIDFLQAEATHVSIHDILSPDDVPDLFKGFFTFDRMISYSGHFNPLAAVQVTELSDGIFIGLSVNHAVTDGTSFWHFFNTFSEICKGTQKISKTPNFSRDTVFDSDSVLKFPPGGPQVTFAADEALRERIFHFSRDSILKLKYRANRGSLTPNPELLGKQSNDTVKRVDEISSFQSLCAQLWRCVTRARNLDPSKLTTFRMAVNCRHRLDPRLHPYYFGNAIQSIPTVAPAGELLAQDPTFGAEMLHKNVVAHSNETVRRGVAEWEKAPRLFPLGNADGASITMGSSPRFPMYNNDFGWGLPVAVRSGRANKFDGKISAFPGREGNGSVDLEVVLAPQTMSGLENDPEFMQYVSAINW